ncbi:unnamed protein product [Discula destructiva]
MQEDSLQHGSVPLIALNRRQKSYQPLRDDNFEFDSAYSSGANYEPHPQNMARSPLAGLRGAGGSKKSGFLAITSSYVFDWCIIIVILGVAYYLNHHEPNRRPFSLEDPNISFPYTVNETVPPWLLLTLCAALPIVVIPIVSLIFVPGHTVPRGTPASLIWKRKLWELHVGWLGFALAISATFFITNGMKNMCGKPRPDLLSRCNADLDNFANYVIGGLNVADGYQRLVSADICRGVDGIDLADGFRSYPSGHASSSAAGLIYLSLFLASKFAITIPFLAPGSGGGGGSGGQGALTYAAFPSRSNNNNNKNNSSAHQDLDAPHDPAATRLFSAHNARLASVRQQAAAPPIYLLIFSMSPFFTAIFVASSRWFDFRHHGFDILFGFLIGAVCAWFSFRWYHLPVAQGAGWAWGPRCADKAWWAGVGSFSYAMDWEEDIDDGGAPIWRSAPPADEDAAMEEGRGLKTLSLGRLGSAAQGAVGDHEARRRMQ